MNIVLTQNKSPWNSIQGLFASRESDRTVKEQACLPLGIKRTVFMENVVDYTFPVLPSDVKTTQQLIKEFGIKRHSYSFKKVTTALRNTFKK